VHEGDRLGRLKLSADGMEARDRQVLSWAHAKGAPVAMVMGGGYGRRMEDTVAVQLNSYRVALSYAQAWGCRA
jgi:acetoin utilization deacetylase AcuC-like enzyme